MARVVVHESDVEFEDPKLVEGLPGVGLVGKIATDHLVNALEMTHYASLRECEGLPKLAMYQSGDRTVHSPVRFYADEERDLLTMQSDVPIPRAAAEAFSDCVTNWLAEEGIVPIYLSGLGTEDKEAPPKLFGLATADGEPLLDDADVSSPPASGLVSGPTGALLARAAETDLDAVGLVVESNEEFPDPESARQVLKNGVQPLADVEIPLDKLVEQANEIRDAKEQLAEQVHQGDDEERTEAKELRMYQ